MINLNPIKWKKVKYVNAINLIAYNYIAHVFIKINNVQQNVLVMIAITHKNI